MQAAPLDPYAPPIDSAQDDPRVADEVLASRAVAGDRPALEALLARHAPWIFNIAVRMVWRREDAADVTQEAVEVTEAVTEVTGEAAEVTGAAAEVLVLDTVLAAAEVPELEPVPELVLVPVAAAAEPVLVPVTAEVTEPMADVTGPVAEVTGPAEAGGTVAACACRENTSKATMIPAATIATCTARRAMSRTIGCAMSSSRTTGGQIRPGS